MWERESGERVTPGAKMFLVDQYLPVWVRCTLPECRKWRKLPPAIELHHVKQDIVKCSNCSRPEDEVVAMVKKEEWINTVSYTPMLRFSLLAPLLSEYFPDGVGISPATIRHSSTARKRVGKLVKKDVTQPGNNRGSAIADGRGNEGVGEGGGETKEEEKRKEGDKEVESMLGKVAESVRGGEEGGREGREGGEGEKGRQMVKVEGERVAVEPTKKEVAWKTLVDKNGHHVPATLLHPLHPFHHPHEGPRAQ
ncbi:Lysine-specific histone demethylase 1B, partial [Geodia barretti]